MKASKHIFIQIYTDKIIELHERNGKISNQEALNNSLIYDQGSMSMGNPVKKFHIEADKKEQVYFTIIPFYLFSRNKLFFEDFSVVDGPIIKTIPTVSESSPQVSFSIDASSVNTDKSLHFDLKIVLTYEDLNGVQKQIFFMVDPVLQVKQD